MTIAFTLRLPEELEASLAAMRAPGQSRHAQILQILEDFVGDFDPALVLGFIELLSGEIAADAICPECHQEFGDLGVYLGYTADLKSFGPVCGLCATTK